MSPRGVKPEKNKMAAAVVRSLLSLGPSPGLDVLGLPFPQRGCCFFFQDPKQALPSGALAWLWAKGPPFRWVCKFCGGNCYCISFSGGLGVGGFKGVCIQCEVVSSAEWKGGMLRISRALRQALAGSPWWLSGGRFGGIVGSEGSELRALLSARCPEEAPAMQSGPREIVEVP